MKRDNQIKVFLDPRSRILYSSYYILGLIAVFGKRNITFSSKHFKDLNRILDSNSYDHYMPVVIYKFDLLFKKIIIDFRDKSTIKEYAYKWCDIYAKVNFNRVSTEEKYLDKIISIPPGFGIKIWNLPQTIFYCIYLFLLCKGSPLVSIKNYLADFYSQSKRQSITYYLKNKSKKFVVDDSKPYVFMVATLWPHQNCKEGTNLLRKSFIESCKRLNCFFDGGFFINDLDPQYYEYKDIASMNYCSHKEYIDKTKLSTIVFNTPSVHNCHGWKLGEYLILGKAIISTRISNELPEPLIHGENIHIVEKVEDLEKEINYILFNPEYRKKLQNGALSYATKYVLPDAVIKYIFKSLSW